MSLGTRRFHLLRRPFHSSKCRLSNHYFPSTFLAQRIMIYILADFYHWMHLTFLVDREESSKKREISNAWFVNEVLRCQNFIAIRNGLTFLLFYILARPKRLLLLQLILVTVNHQTCELTSKRSDISKSIIFHVLARFRKMANKRSLVQTKCFYWKIH